MKAQTSKTINALYSRYLEWFQERAGKEGVPWEKEDFSRFQSFHEDVCETDRLFLNRMYYIIPLSPAHSLSGKLETFAFSELNLLEMSGDEIVNVRPAEYRVE